MTTGKMVPLVRQIMKYKTIPEAAQALGRDGSADLVSAFTTIMFLAEQVTSLEAQLKQLEKSRSYHKLDKLNVYGATTGRHSCSGRPVAGSIVWAGPINWKTSSYSADPRIDPDAPGF